MSSTQYIKIFNDTVLKQSILQGYESQRTDKNLGNFTMGELAFTRDTGRVFVGTYTDNKKSSDIPYVIDDEPNPGGLLVGNKYYGASKGGTKLTHYPTYNSSRKVYNGDYTFDVNSCSLLLFDNNIKNGNEIDEITVVNKTLNKTTNDIYNNGFIKMRILEPDNDTIKLDKSSNHNVLKADFTFNRVAEYFGNNWNKAANTIEIGNIKLENSATCNLPSTVKFNSTEITFQGYEDISNNFPTYLLCGENTKFDENKNPIGKYNVSFKKFTEVINLVGGDGIKISYDNPTDTNETPQIIISLDDNAQNPNPGTGDGDDGDNYDSKMVYSSPWEMRDRGYYSGVSRFSADGKIEAVEVYGNTKVVIPNGVTENQELTTVFDENIVAGETNYLDKQQLIKNNYIGELYNIGINYLKSPLGSFYYPEIQSDKTYKLTSMTLTTALNNNVNGLIIADMALKDYGDDDYLPLFPSHVQSIIFQITTPTAGTTPKTATVKMPTGTNTSITLLQTSEANLITTVEVPLSVVPLAYQVTQQDSNGNETPVKDALGNNVFSYELHKKLKVQFSNCTPKILGYRV